MKKHEHQTGRLEKKINFFGGSNFLALRRLQKTVLLLISLMAAVHVFSQEKTEVAKDPVKMHQPNVKANTMEVSFGDHLVALGAPYDSEATIRENFEAAQKYWGVNRVLFRGQTKYFFDNFDFPCLEDETHILGHIWKRFFENNENASKAVKIGKDLGLEMWLWIGLFEFGSSKATGGSSFLPYFGESKLRKNHPEWLPVNKYGTRRQSGPIEFCYPEARAAYIETLKAFLLQEGYEGIAFYTYVENFGTRYLDEFGFNQPIVDEFKRRYHVDILTEPFDKEAWAALRGEYVTQFLRELRRALLPRNIKISVDISSEEINGEGPRPDLPSAWPVAWSKLDPQRIGRIRMDWRTWVNEGIVDNLKVARPGTPSVVRELLDYCQKNNPQVQVSVWQTWYEPVPEGAIHLMPTISGVYCFPREQFRNPTNHFNDPAYTLAHGDKWEKRQVLYLAWKKLITLKISDMAVASADKDVFVRHRAVMVLGSSGLPEAIPLIEDRLNDSENSVRCLAATTLGTTPGPESLKKILDTIVTHGNCQYNLSAVRQSFRQMQAKGALGAKQKALVRDYFTHADHNVRQSVVYAVNGKGLESEFKNELLNMARNDTDGFCKTHAMRALPALDIADAYPVLQKALEDNTNQIIQVRAAEVFELYGNTLPAPYRAKALPILLELFRQYDSDSKRVDVDWGWRSVGYAILSLGKTGEAALEELMRNPNTDQKLADLAWRVLYIRQYRMKLATVTEEQDELAHKQRPDKKRFRDGNR